MNQSPLILLIDDNKSLLTMMSRVLKHEGYRTATALNGRMALATFEEVQPDLVILDILMPGIDGFQVLDKMRMQSHLPVIVLSAATDDEWLEQSLIAGADDYIKKPFSIRELLARIRAKLRRVDFSNSEEIIENNTAIAFGCASHVPSAYG